jgi:hypothetical protein
MIFPSAVSPVQGIGSLSRTLARIKQKPQRTENLIFEGEKNKKHASISGRPQGTPHILVSFCGKELRPHSKNSDH